MRAAGTDHHTGLRRRAGSPRSGVALVTPLLVSAALLLSGCASEALPSASPEVTAPTAASSPLLVPPAAAPRAPAPRTPAPRPAPGPTRVTEAPAAIPVTSAELDTTRPARGTVPVRLEVASLEIAMDVTPVGTEDDGEMSLPPSVADAGWYEFGSRPVDPAGTTVLAAHVDSAPEGLGPFARLRSARPGASVTLTSRDGTRHRYRVDSVDVVAKDQIPLGEVFDREGAPRLVLVTCGGAYDRRTGYRDNVVVTASPMSPERP